jgi:hypothetical protein
MHPGSSPDPVRGRLSCSSVSSKWPNRSLERSNALWIRHSPLRCFAARPALGTELASMIRISRPPAFAGAGYGPRLGHMRNQRFADQLGQPITAPAQAVKQAHVGDVHQADSGRPARGRTQAPTAQAISQHQSQQHHRSGDLSSPREGLGPQCPDSECLGPAEALYGAVPVVIQQRIASHPMLESEAFPQCKGNF